MARGERILFTNISLSISERQAIVLRGMNGAGKTTLLRILAGLTHPETGTIERSAPLHWIGHSEGLKPHETPRNHLKLWASAWGCDISGLETIFSALDLSNAVDVPARYLSAGQRRRTALARLLLEDRPLWLLDEPMTALDANGRAIFADLIASHRAKGGALIAAIHGDAGFDLDTEVTL